MILTYEKNSLILGLLLLLTATGIAQTNQDSVYTTCDMMPVFLGGDSACKNFIYRNIVMPVDALNSYVEGAGVIQFVVERNGNVSSAEIKRGIMKSLNEELVRVMNTMSGWTPAQVNNHPVRCKVEIPIAIRQFDYLKFDSLVEYLDSNYMIVLKGQHTHYRVVKKGDLNFIVKYYLNEGTLIEEQECRKLKPLIKHGYVRAFYSNGKVKTYGFCYNNMREGVFNSYTKDGGIQSEENYKNNKLDGLCTYYKEMSDSDFVEKTYKMDSLSNSIYKYYNYKGEVLNSVCSDPEFPGGDSGRINYLRKKVKYPWDAREKNIQGTVYVSFVVERDGSISKIKLLKDIGGGCGDEAIKVVRKMPKWKAGTINGTPIRTQFVLPIKFVLTD